MKKFILLLTGSLTCLIATAQVRQTETAFVSFYSELEEVTAENFSGVSELNTTTGDLLFSFAIQSFFFENATMQKHFNEADVMDSKQFPRAKFVGRITDNYRVNYTGNGRYTVHVKGDLTIKGTTLPVETRAELIIENGKITATASFELDRYQYGVNGQQGSISQILELTVKASYE